VSESLATGERVTPLGHRVNVVPSPENLLDLVTVRFLECVGNAPAGGRFVLAGGSTPMPLYERLAARGHSRTWNLHRYLTSDERCVPPEHADSNFGRIQNALWKPLGVDPARVLRFLGEKSPERAAEVMHRELIDLGQRVPLFDLVLLGLGEDGHVASLFTAEAWPDFGLHLAAATQHPESGSHRVSLTPLALRSTRQTWFLVAGARKQEAVRRALAAAESSSLLPATMVSGAETHWFLDAEAAGHDR
jgi:6-phosphogluconolactonase